MHLYRHPHPGVDTAFPIANANRKFSRACCRSGISSTGFNEYICRVFWLQALRSRNRISRQLIEWWNESSAESCDLGEGVEFAACVLQCGRLPRIEADCRQLKSPSRGVQQGIEPPRASDVIGLEFRDEELELGSSVLPRFASTGASSIDRGTKCPWIAGITHANRKWFRLCQGR